MATRRKDQKGRVLNAGESQRKNLTYQYRYTDANGERKTVYAKDLTALRAKEEEIQKAASRHVSYGRGNVTVSQLLESHIQFRADDIRYNTLTNMQFVYGAVQKYDLSKMLIRNVKVSHCKELCRQLQQDGYGFGTIRRVKSVLSVAFKTAVEDDVLIKNPMDFRLDFLSVQYGTREALLPEEQEKMLDFLKRWGGDPDYLDEFIIFLGTGLRASEMAGLTFRNIDFEHKAIQVDHQLLRRFDCTLYCEKPKTEKGNRLIPMSSAVEQSLRNIIARRPKLNVEPLVDGYSGFLFIDKHHHPKIALHFQAQLRRMVRAYNRQNPDDPMRNITPHMLRHTFCTNMINLGMLPKNVQYVMGHASVSVTMDIYAHSTYQAAQEQMHQLLGERPAEVSPIHAVK